jgi:hypothetical protein
MAACGEPEMSSSDAAADLEAAVDRTLEAPSFHIHSVSTHEGEDHAAETDYVAPDRVRSVLPSSEESIFIGRDLYASEPGDPTQFVQTEMPCATTIDMAVSALAIVREADEVRLVGDTYVFDTPDATVSGEAQLDDGYLASLVVRYPLTHIGEVTERHTFSDYGAEFSIEPPSAEKITRGPVASAAPGVIVVDEGSPIPCP